MFSSQANPKGLSSGKVVVNELLFFIILNYDEISVYSLTKFSSLSPTYTLLEKFNTTTLIFET